MSQPIPFSPPGSTSPGYETITTLAFAPAMQTNLQVAALHAAGGTMETGIYQPSQVTEQIIQQPSYLGGALGQAYSTAAPIFGPVGGIAYAAATGIGEIYESIPFVNTWANQAGSTGKRIKPNPIFSDIHWRRKGICIGVNRGASSGSGHPRLHSRLFGLGRR